MSMRSKLAAAWLTCALTAWAQGPRALAASSFQVHFPKDAPVAVMAADWGESRETLRGSALLLDLHTSLTLRNLGPRNIRGITLLVLAQAVTPGGKASVSVPGLDVKPGETFPVRLDLRLLRPGAAPGPWVSVELDGVLFDDLSFYGADRLNCRRQLTAWELEARRDRQYLRSLLEARGPEALRDRMLEILSERPRLDVRLQRTGRAAASPAGEPVRFALVNLPGAPLELLGGEMLVAGAEARRVRVEVVNRSGRPVRYFEVAWLLRDPQGTEYFAGSLPGSPSELLLPGRRAEASQEAAFQFSSPSNSAFQIAGCAGFLTQVEFADGTLWIPDRRSLDEPRLRRVAPPSAEEQRLAEIYRRHGLQALVAEIKKR